eukprot:104326_1
MCHQKCIAWWLTYHVSIIYIYRIYDTPIRKAQPGVEGRNNSRMAWKERGILDDAMDSFCSYSNLIIEHSTTNARNMKSISDSYSEYSTAAEISIRSIKYTSI